MPKKVNRGNATKIDPQQDIVPRFLTNTIVPKKEQQGNRVPQPLEENVLAAKLDVDENHK